MVLLPWYPRPPKNTRPKTYFRIPLTCDCIGACVPPILESHLVCFSGLGATRGPSANRGRSSPELKGPRQFLRSRPEIFDFGPDLALKGDTPRGKDPARCPQTQRFRTILGRFRRVSTTIRNVSTVSFPALERGGVLPLASGQNGNRILFGPPGRERAGVRPLTSRLLLGFLVLNSAELKGPGQL